MQTKNGPEMLGSKNPNNAGNNQFQLSDNVEQNVSRIVNSSEIKLTPEQLKLQEELLTLNGKKVRPIKMDSSNWKIEVKRDLIIDRRKIEVIIRYNDTGDALEYGEGAPAWLIGKQLFNYERAMKESGGKLLNRNQLEVFMGNLGNKVAQLGIQNKLLFLEQFKILSPYGLAFAGWFTPKGNSSNSPRLCDNVLGMWSVFGAGYWLNQDGVFGNLTDDHDWFLSAFSIED